MWKKMRELKAVVGDSKIPENERLEAEYDLQAILRGLPRFYPANLDGVSGLMLDPDLTPEGVEIPHKLASGWETIRVKEEEGRSLLDGLLLEIADRFLRRKATIGELRAAVKAAKGE